MITEMSDTTPTRIAEEIASLLVKSATGARASSASISAMIAQFSPSAGLMGAKAAIDWTFR
jgi:hypothetical protein